MLQICHPYYKCEIHRWLISPCPYNVQYAKYNILSTKFILIYSQNKQLLFNELTEYRVV